MSSDGKQTSGNHQSWRWQWCVCATTIALGALFLLTCNWSLHVDGISQERLDRALPPLTARDEVAQSFVAPRSNLSGVEVLLARYEGQGQEGDHHMTMRLCAGSCDGPVVATASADISQAKHNDPVRFSFSAVEDSQDQRFFMILESGPVGDTGLWCTEEDAYGEGALYLDGEATGGDLRFKTLHEYTPGMVCHDLLSLGRAWAWLLPWVAGVLFLPGLWLLSRRDSLVESDPLRFLSVTASLSLALVPLILLWGSVIDLRLDHWMLPVLGLSSVLGMACWLGRTKGTGPGRPRLSRESVVHLGVAALLVALLLALRFVQIRDIRVPLWVDSVHHTMITQLIRDTGQVPHTYRPFMPVDNFIYHFGFHSYAATLGWLTGAASHEMVLILGQVLNVLCATSVYLLTVRVSRSRLAGMLAFVAVGFVSAMPAYYVSWGRYTQLAGMVILPVAMAAFMRVCECRERCWRELAVAALLAAGLFVTHYRVTIFYASFCLVWTASWAWVKRSDSRSLVRGLKNVLVTLGCAAVAVGPWVYRLGVEFILPWRTFPARLAGDAAYSAMPWDLLWSGNNRVLLPVAAAGLLLALWQRKRDLTVIGVWALATLVLLNPTLWGGSPTWLVTSASLVISLYLPVGVLAGYFLAYAAEKVCERIPAGWKVVWGGALACVLVLVLVRGTWNSVNVVNPVTALVTEADLDALEWIKTEVPEDALFLVNTRPWQLGMYMGTDAGWWIRLLTGRKTTMPPVLYTMGSPDYVEDVNRIAELSQQAPADDAGMLELLRQAGVTHVYVGARGGPFSPRILLESLHYRMVYSSGEVWIFEFVG